MSGHAALLRLQAALADALDAPVATGPAPVARERPLPVLTLTPVRDERLDEQDSASAWYQRWERQVLIEGLVDGADDWAFVLDDLLEQVRATLVEFPESLSTRTVTFYPPEEGGTLAWFSLPIAVRYTVDYSP